MEEKTSLNKVWTQKKPDACETHRVGLLGWHHVFVMPGGEGVWFVAILRDSVSPESLRSLHDPDHLVATPVSGVDRLAAVAVGRLAAVAGVVNRPGTAVR